MKTQIIPLEPYDNLISVRDKLAWARTPRILLVWPPRGRVDLRPLDLKLLQRRARELGAQLGLVTRSDDMIQTARQLGVPVFASAAEAQRAAWPAPVPPSLVKRRTRRPDLRSLREQIQAHAPAWLSHPLVRLGFFALGVLAALMVVAFFIPRAEIVVPMPVQMQSVDLPVSAGSSVPSVSLVGNLPTQRVDVTLEGTDAIPVSGTVSLPQIKAQGTVTFRNLTTNPVVVPAGTWVRTLDVPPLRFQTTRAGTVPAGIDGKLDLPVEALQPGKGGNVPAGAIQALEGALGPLLVVSNDKALAGGADLSLRGPSVSDQQRLRKSLLASLERQALTTLEQQINDGLLLPNTLQADILEETYNPPVGQPGDRLTLSLRVRFSAEFIRRSDLEVLANAVLDADLAPGQAAVPDSLTWEQLTQPVTGEDGLSRFPLRLKRRVWQVVPAGRVIQLTQGLSPALARQRLQANLDLAGSPRFSLWPEWWPWLPLAPTRIDVTFEFP